MLQYIGTVAALQIMPVIPLRLKRKERTLATCYAETRDSECAIVEYRFLRSSQQVLAVGMARNAIVISRHADDTLARYANGNR